MTTGQRGIENEQRHYHQHIHLDGQTSRTAMTEPAQRAIMDDDVGTVLDELDFAENV
jgi:hypothetical protein